MCRIDLKKGYIDLIKVKYEDGYRYMTQEEYDRLYTMKDLKNTVSSFGSFLFENRGLVIGAFSFLYGFVGFNSSVNATTKETLPIDHSFNTSEKIENTFDPEISYQHFLERTGNLKVPKTRPFGKSYRIGSAFDKDIPLKNNFPKNLLTLASFLNYGKKNEIFLPRPVITNVENVLRGGKIIFSYRGGFTPLLSSGFLFPFIFSILGMIDLIRKTKKTIDGVKDILKDQEDEEDNPKKRKRLPNFWFLLETTKNPIVLGIAGIFILWVMKNHPNTLPETVTAPFGITRKRTWKEYFRTYLDFRTPKPYIILASGGILLIIYRNGSGILTFLKEKQPMTVIFEDIVIKPVKDIILPTIKPEDILFDNKDNDGKYKFLGGENF
jgi:hypothetical protein